jgi:DHA1 family inner membrane transport protein
LTPPPDAPGVRRALYALGAAQFVVGATSLGVIGLVEEMRDALGVSTAAIAGLVTVFALVYALAAPGLQAVIGHLPRRGLVVGAMTLSAASCGLCALAQDYQTVVIARIGMALGAALIGPTAAAAAASMVTPERRSGALAVVFGGLTLATVLGIPLTSWLGHAFGWRLAWGAIGAAALLAAPAVWLAMPGGGRGARSNLAALAAVLVRRPFALSITATMVMFTGGFATYALLAVWLLEAAGVARDALPGALLAYGIVGVAGNVASGPLSRRLGPDGVVTLTLAVVTLAALALWAAAGSAAGSAWAIWPPLMAMGAFWIMFNAPMQAHLIGLNPAQAPLALALNASALYVGMAAGSALGGAVYAAMGAGPLPLVTAFGVAMSLLVFRSALRASRP